MKYITPATTNAKIMTEYVRAHDGCLIDDAVAALGLTDKQVRAARCHNGSDVKVVRSKVDGVFVHRWVITQTKITMQAAAKNVRRIDRDRARYANRDLIDLQKWMKNGPKVYTGPMLTVWQTVRPWELAA
jgi:hypothetical protein